MKKIFNVLINITIIISALIVITRLFFVDYKKVSGVSMLNTLQEGDIVLFNKTKKNYSRYDVVAVIKDDYVIKRIIGLPGETIECKGGIVYINDVPIKENYILGVTSDFEKIIIPDDEYYILGDNREKSVDSRLYCTISIRDIKGIMINKF